MWSDPLTVFAVSIISGDKLEDLEEANPFSFKEFLKTKNLSLSKEDTTNSRIYPKVHLGSCRWLPLTTSLLTYSFGDRHWSVGSKAGQLWLLMEKLGGEQLPGPFGR